jgi:hypothetical protein
MVRYPDKIIRFRVHPELIVKGPFPPPPLSPEMINQGEEPDQLLSRLGFPDVTGPDLRSLLGAADQNLDWLLARLRMLVQEQRHFSSIFVLRGTVGQLYWVRG